MDIEKLIKVLGMTGSTHDGEALAALRTAQRMMAAAKVSWADLIKPAAKPMQHQNDASHYRSPQYSDIFRDAARDPYYQADRAAYEASQKAKAKQRAAETAAEYEEIVRKYREAQQQTSQRSPGFGDDLYEAIFGKKRK